MNLLQTIPLYGPLSDANGAPAGGGNPDQTDWKVKYDELQLQITSGQYVTKDAYVTLQRNLEQAVNIRQAKEAELGQVNAKVVLLTDGQTTMSKTLADMETTVNQTKAQLAEKESKILRHGVIFKQFPALAPFEADGLLPVPQGEQKLEDVLTAFQTRLGALTAEAKTNFQQNSTIIPPKPPEETKKSSLVALAEAKALTGQGKVVEAQAKMAEYHRLKTQETS